MTADLRLGRWQDVLAGVVVDHLIMDPPYSDRTEAGDYFCRDCPESLQSLEPPDWGNLGFGEWLCRSCVAKVRWIESYRGSWAQIEARRREQMKRAALFFDESP